MKKRRVIYIEDADWAELRRTALIAEISISELIRRLIDFRRATDKVTR
jgi:hypothetical protein